MIGADTSARFLYLSCADDYYESLDMATALHPQTLLCYEMYDQPLDARAWCAAAAEHPYENWLQAGEISDGSEGHQCFGQSWVLGRSGLFGVLWAVRVCSAGIFAGLGDQKRGRDAPATAAETAALLEAA